MVKKRSAGLRDDLTRYFIEQSEDGPMLLGETPSVWKIGSSGDRKPKAFAFEFRWPDGAINR
jgi:hypothetical protein